MIKASLPSLQQQSKTPRTLPPFLVAAMLIVCGAGSFWLYHWARDLHRFTQGISGYTALFIGQLSIYLVACYFATRKQLQPTRKMTLLLATVILIFAAAFRFDLVAQNPYLSTDAYRYVWDGRVQAAGINPYLYAPSAPELAHLRDGKIFPNINRSDFTNTPYPPGAQMIFLLSYLLHPSSVMGFKILMTLFDLIAIVAVMFTLARAQLAPVQAVIFAWHPLLIYEGAHTGHVESGFIVFLTLTLLAWSYKKPTITGIMLAFATLVKYYPALLLPVFLFANNDAKDESSKGDFCNETPELAVKNHPRFDRTRVLNRARILALFNKANFKMLAAFCVTIALAYLPYLTMGKGTVASLANEFNEEGFTGKGSRYFLLVLARHFAPVPTTIFLLVAALALIAFAIYLMLKIKRNAIDVARAAMTLIGLYFFLVTPRYHWYYAWVLPFLCFAPRLSWLYLTGATVLLYALWFTPLIYPEIPVWLGVSLFAPTLVLIIWESRKEKMKDAGLSR
jgi:hypothetical protein